MTEKERRALRKLIREELPTTTDKMEFLAKLVTLLKEVQRTSLALAKALEDKA